MATLEHRILADIVKTTHATLRQEARDHGPEIAWQRHLARSDLLQKYAISMRELATTHWKENNSDEKRRTRCRVEWIKSQCREYFFDGGREKYNEREDSINLKLNQNTEKAISSQNSGDSGICTSVNTTKEVYPTQKISLLDVGSCYNPFGTDSVFDVTPIDLIGGDNRVLRCDFLNVSIGNGKTFSSDGLRLLQLPENSYDVVVFSLFMEYLPCPKQRHVCCRKAYKLLKLTGVLVIVTPDSKHVNANAKLMKSWRYVLSKLGFMRIKYEKLRHLHCLVFRKCILKEVAIRWAKLQVVPENDPLYLDDTAIHIPQDFQSISNENLNSEKNVEGYSADELISGFGELPYGIV